jgi:hypothetical protein
MTVAAGPGSYTVEFEEDANAFLAAAGDHLALDPVLSTVVSTMALRIAAAQAAQHPGLWREPSRAGLHPARAPRPGVRQRRRGPGEPDAARPGRAVCLFTDQANPTSNRIYQALGYPPVVDMANLLIG